MRRNQILAITLCSLACLGYANTSANAGWFGPSNYEECMLEKMKDQSPYMLKTAQDACRAKFKDDSKEVSLDQRLIQFNWCMDEQTAKQICIVDKPNNYEITSVELYFYDCTRGIMGGYPRLPDPCDYATLHTITGEKSYFSATYTFKIPPGNYKWGVGFKGFIK
jgi:hypothetical protein